MLGLRGLEADDRHGHQLGLVIQHDSVHWADVLDAVAVSAPIIEQLGHPLAECARSGRCGVCAAVRALSRLRARWMQTGLGAEDLGRVEVSGNTVGASRSVPAVARRLLLVSGWPDRLTSEAGRRAARASGQAGRLAAGGSTPAVAHGHRTPIRGRLPGRLGSSRTAPAGPAEAASLPRYSTHAGFRVSGCAASPTSATRSPACSCLGQRRAGRRPRSGPTAGPGSASTG